MHSTLETSPTPGPSPADAATSTFERELASPDRRSYRRRAVTGGVLVAAVAVGGTLFMGVPSAEPDLPNPAVMAAVGQGRNTVDENVAFWTERVEAVPTSAGFRAQLAAAQVAAADGDQEIYAEAAATARAAIELDPDSERARLVLADALSAQHDFAAAFAIAEDVLADTPDSVGALLAAGDAQLELGNYTDARRRYDQVARLVGGEPAVTSRFARLALVVGTPDEAAELARRALVDAGDDDLPTADAAFYWFQLATMEHRRGEQEAAEQHLRAALAIDSAHGGSTELLARVLVARGELDEATSVYEALVAEGGGADLHGELADLYVLAGRDAEATALVEEGLAIAVAEADQNPAERRHLIDFLADHDPAFAVELAAADLAERADVHAHAWHAWTLFRSGDVDAARIAIEPALAYGTQDALLRYQAGAIFAANGETARAIEFLTAALEQNDGFDLRHAADAERLLRSLT